MPPASGFAAKILGEDRRNKKAKPNHEGPCVYTIRMSEREEWTIKVKPEHAGPTHTSNVQIFKTVVLPGTDPDIKYPRQSLRWDAKELLHRAINTDDPDSDNPKLISIPLREWHDNEDIYALLNNPERVSAVVYMFAGNEIDFETACAHNEKYLARLASPEPQTISKASNKRGREDETESSSSTAPGSLAMPNCEQANTVLT